MLDELMGSDRNMLPSERAKRKRHFSDDDVCKNFLVRFCFNGLFDKTKCDLGTCRFIHPDTLKEEWERFPNKGKYPYERDFLATCNRMIADVDSRTKRLKAKYNTDNINTLRRELDETIRKTEEYAEEGKIDESAAMNIKMEAIQAQLKKLEAGAPDGQVVLLPGGEKNVIPCDVCGAAVSRDQISHFEGKQHIGYEAIRAAAAELEKSLSERTEQPESKERKGSRERDQDRDRERERDRDRGRDDRDRRDSRDQDRDRRDRDRDRDRDRHRDYDRDRGYGRDRDRGDRDRYYDRDRDWKRPRW
uniref:Uncharacterized protein n=1 Tax=Eutreptiella gymnastica TaxID=73025 RepID=A0A7S1IX56_9EUGL